MFWGQRFIVVCLIVICCVVGLQAVAQDGRARETRRVKQMSLILIQLVDDAHVVSGNPMDPKVKQIQAQNKILADRQKAVVEKDAKLVGDLLAGYRRVRKPLPGDKGPPFNDFPLQSAVVWIVSNAFMQGAVAPDKRDASSQLPDEVEFETFLIDAWHVLRVGPDAVDPDQILDASHFTGVSRDLIKVDIQSVPQGADICLWGKRGAVGKTNGTRWVLPGKVPVYLSLDGYRRSETLEEFSKGKDSVEIKLVKE
jgi:hypothetical protein